VTISSAVIIIIIIAKNNISFIPDIYTYVTPELVTVGSRKDFPGSVWELSQEKACGRSCGGWMCRSLKAGTFIRPLLPP
jgi:hypothetical protein